MAIAFECRHVSVRRSGNQLLEDVSLTIEDWQRWVVLGPNGAGKTTLLKLMSGNLFPSDGEVTILGERMGSVDLRELKPRIGMAGFHVANTVPGAELVRDVVMSSAFGVIGRWNENYEEADQARARQILGEMGIAHLAERTFGTLSEGERKRVMIARALMTDPELLLLDEPGAGLDLGGREDLVLSLKVLAEEPRSPVIALVTHHVEEIPSGFTHVLMLRKGRIVAAGELATTLTAENLSATYDMKLTLTHEDGRFSARRSSYGHRAL